MLSVDFMYKQFILGVIDAKTENMDVHRRNIYNIKCGWMQLYSYAQF